MDFIQRGTWNWGENAEKALPDWTKSNEARKIREKADFGWIKSNQASPNPAQPARSYGIMPITERSRSIYAFLRILTHSPRNPRQEVCHPSACCRPSRNPAKADEALRPVERTSGFSPLDSDSANRKCLKSFHLALRTRSSSVHLMVLVSNYVVVHSRPRAGGSKGEETSN
ncbi:hypothetical protein [Cohnella massiliensis]|uniref:hypothetical protein n=1 Tax=Cohnella massiliensis TaxID=1816691 RepID=UPI001118502C|nr:hypothetical protein [Cohnella massiliensis]